MKYALFVHIFYPHIYQEILQRLKNIPFRYNLYANLVENHTDSLAADILKNFPNAKIIISPNIGMDCGGNLRNLQSWFNTYRAEEFLIFLHSKGKPLTEKPEKIKETDELRNLLWSIVTPEKYPLVEKAFENDACGMVGVREWHRYPGLAHGDPIPECQHFCELLGLNNYETNRFGFIGGTIFFVRAKIFRDVFSKVDILKIVEELPEYSNGGDIHALERVFGYCAISEGYSIKGV